MDVIDWPNAAVIAGGLTLYVYDVLMNVAFLG
jgi:hypothetical protein